MKGLSKGDRELKPQGTLLGVPENQASLLTGAPDPERSLLVKGLLFLPPYRHLPLWVSTTLAHFVSSVLSGLKLPHQPLELSCRICGVDQEPEVLTGTKIHIERDEAEAGAWGKCIEPPNSETK